jgi:hypothetical protein
MLAQDKGRSRPQILDSRNMKAKIMLRLPSIGGLEYSPNLYNCVVHILGDYIEVRLGGDDIDNIQKSKGCLKAVSRINSCHAEPSHKVEEGRKIAGKYKYAR